MQKQIYLTQVKSSSCLVAQMNNSLSLSLVNRANRVFVAFFALLTKFALLFLLVQFANAESSGAFLGAEVGYGGAKAQIKLQTASPQTTYNDAFNSNGSGVNYGILVGYKHFFNDYVGLRAYGSFNAQHSIINGKNFNTNTPESVNYTSLNVGANLDFLANFVSTQMLDFGSFVGFRLGYNYWLGDDIETEKNSLQDAYNQLATTIQNGSVHYRWNYGSFDAALNVGLRTNIAKHHGIELAARVPFIPTDFLDLKYNDSRGNGAESAHITRKLYKVWNLNIRYIFSL